MDKIPHLLSGEFTTAAAAMHNAPQRSVVIAIYRNDHAWNFYIPGMGQGIAFRYNVAVGLVDAACMAYGLTMQTGWSAPQTIEAAVCGR